MEEGLTHSDFGVLILSPSFFKHGLEQELSALSSLESLNGEKKILPVLLDLSWKTLTLKSPFLAARRAVEAHLSVNAGEGVRAVAEALLRVRGPKKQDPSKRPQSLLRGKFRTPSRLFVGREEDLTAVRVLLLEAETEAVRIAASIEGLGASERPSWPFSWCTEGAFPGGIYWLEAEDQDFTVQWNVVADDLGVAQAPRKTACRPY